jgi:hypothetical protein
MILRSKSARQHDFHPMKFTSLLLAGSLIANLALVAVLAIRFSSGAGHALRGSSPPSVIAPAAVTIADVDPQTWNQLDAGEPASFAMRLRTAGFPPSLIRAIVDAHVRERFTDRYRALLEAEAAKPYWRGGAMGMYTGDPKINAARRALRHEEDALRKELLGAEADRVPDATLASLRQRFGDLPREKLVQLQKINADYNELTAEARDESGEIILPEDRARLALLQKERDADIARLLTPEEKAEYEFRHSTTANRVRSQLAAFNPTEAEYRALFALQRTIDVTYGNLNTLSPDERRLRNTAQRELIGQIEAALGPARFADYQQATDAAYQSVNQLVTRLELPPATTAQVVALQKEMLQRMNALQADRTIAGPQRQVQLAALSEEATRKLTTALGEAGLKAYRSSSGYWVQQLQQAARPPTPPAK